MSLATPRDKAKEAAKMRVIALALQVAAAAPERFNTHGTQAYIPRDIIKAIRCEFDILGIDWRKARRDSMEARP